MTTTVAKSTSRGQITLPKKWRSKFATTLFKMKMLEDKLVIEPMVEDEEEYDLSGEEVIFDAKRDNNGKGVPIEDFVTALRESLREDG